MKKNLFFKLSFFVIFIILAFTSALVIKDILDHKNLSVKTSHFYSLKGKAEKLVFKQHDSRLIDSEPWVEVYLKDHKEKWTYSSKAPGYFKLVKALRKCQNVEILFKTADLLKNKEAEIWNAKVCGENMINIKDVLEYKYSNYQGTHQLVKITLMILFIFMLFSFLYFLFRKF